MKKRLLLISNSTNAGEAYLGWPRQHIKDFLGSEYKRVLFVPYAGVGLSADNNIQKSYDIYEAKVAAVYKELGYEIYSIHKEADPIQAVKDAEAIAVGGGNTFHLVYMMHKLGIIPVIKAEVENGMPFMGWSAGSNVACPSLKTTNDMPIIEPASFDCIGLIPFQINPHYLDAHPDGHGGETREQRLEEFMVVNPDIYIAGLREACLLLMENGKIKHIGSRNLRVFKGNQEPKEYSSGDDINFLLG
ncbi:MAG: dipeptidase PepE [Saprospiraceae bacterium]|nr:dipeptidase PepE [Saprospiraceae bacterium]